MSETATPSQLSTEAPYQVAPRHTSEVLLQRSEIEQAAEQAIDAGTIQFKPAPDNFDTLNPNEKIYTTIQLAKSDLDLENSHIQEYTLKYGGSLDGEQVALKDPEAYTILRDKTNKQEVVNRVVGQNAKWYHADKGIAKDVESGLISQMFQLSIGDEKPVDIINFSDRVLTPEEIAQMADVYSKMASISGGNIFESLRGVVIQNPSELGEKTAGSATRFSGVVRLGSHIFDKSDATYGEDFKVNTAVATFTHELGHLIEDMDINRTFYKTVGWESGLVHNFTDDYGDRKVSSKEVLSNPGAEQPFFEDGIYTLKPIGEVFTADELATVKPVTDYAASQGREDYAEGIVPVVHDEKRLVLDAVRRNAILHNLHKGSGGKYGPFKARVEIIDIANLHKPVLDIKPSTYFVKVRNNLIVSDLPEREMRDVTDDYGNVVRAHIEVHPYHGFTDGRKTQSA